MSCSYQVRFKYVDSEGKTFEKTLRCKPQMNCIADEVWKEYGGGIEAAIRRLFPEFEGIPITYSVAEGNCPLRNLRERR